MKLDKYTLQDKRYYAANKELDEIYKKIRSAPSRELAEPYQSGWYITIRLREDYARRTDGPVVAALIKKYGGYAIVKSPTLVKTLRQKPLLSNFNSLLSHRTYYSPLRIRALSEKEYASLSEITKKYFSLIPYRAATYDWKKCYEFNVPEHYLLTKVSKRMITHTRDINPDLLSRKNELEKILEPYWLKFRHRDRYYDEYYNTRAERRQSRVELGKYELDD